MILLGVTIQLLAVKLVQIGQKRIFWFNIALSEVPKCNIQVSKKDKNIHFMQKLQMTMCFSSLIATTFVSILFGLVPYLGLCIFPYMGQFSILFCCLSASGGKSHQEGLDGQQITFIGVFFYNKWIWMAGKEWIYMAGKN